MNALATAAELVMATTPACVVAMTTREASANSHSRLEYERAMNTSMTAFNLLLRLRALAVPTQRSGPYPFFAEMPRCKS